MYIQKVRMHLFSKRSARLHAVRHVGVNTKQMVRAMGSPSVTYGVETIGICDSALHAMRSKIAAAAAPQAGGKNPDLTLYALDGSAGTLDPAFACHTMPVKHWAHAWWERWEEPVTLELAFQEAGCCQW